MKVMGKNQEGEATGTVILAQDPVCGMDVDVARAAARSEFEGQTYYFCAIACKTEFDKNPSNFLGADADESCQCGGCNCCGEGD